MWQISYPPANGVSQGNNFMPKSNKLAVFEKKKENNKRLKNSSGWQSSIFFLVMGKKLFFHIFDLTVWVARSTRSFKEIKQ